MKLSCYLPLVGCSLLLAACASDGGTKAHIAAPRLDTLLGEAASANRAGQYDKALVSLKTATAAYPADKAPWLQIAQLKFDRASYGEAIVNAQEALQRDPANRVATSIVAVSGLRLSTQAIADLARHNNLNGDLRSEALQVAKLLRTSVGEDILVPIPASAPALKRSARRAGAGPAAAPVPSASAGTAVQEGKARPAAANSGADPFGGLK